VNDGDESPAQRADKSAHSRGASSGVRQFAGAFAHGSIDFEAAWLALADKSGDKSPQS